jgi:hypothetical protein
MYQKATPPQPVPSPAAKTKAVSEPVSPAFEKPGETEAYAKVRRLVETNRLDEALTLARSRHDAPMKNAQGVCLMRKGFPAEAIRIYRTMVLDNTGLFLREQIPAVYKTNYALALLLSGHAAGGINILKELAGTDDPSVQKLRSIIDGWKSQLSFLERLGLMLGLEPKRPVLLDFPPGELL